MPLFRFFFAPGARWAVGLSTARCTAVMPFLKHAGHAHGNEGDSASAGDTFASPRHASELW